MRRAARASRVSLAPCDAAPLMALLARSDLETVQEKRRQLMVAIELAKPRRSTILEGSLRNLTHQMLRLQAILKGGRP